MTAASPSEGNVRDALGDATRPPITQELKAALARTSPAAAAAVRDIAARKTK